MDVLDQALEHANEEVKVVSQREEDMKEEEPSITTTATVDDDPHTLSNADTSLYQFPDGDSVSVGSVTYRVVSVTQSNTDTTAAVSRDMHTTSQPGITQVIQAPFNADDASASDGQGGETRFTYFPAAAMADTNGAATTTETHTIQPSPNSGGQFYVMMSPQDVLQGVSQRTIAPRTHQFAPKMDTVRTARDDRRRATHNEVERRRRDKINNWIVKLSKLVPDCVVDQSKQGQVCPKSKGGILMKTCEYIDDLKKANAQMAKSLKDTERLSSKGGILMKTCEYIDDLKKANAQMAKSLKDTERLSVEMEILRQQAEELKNENNVLRAQLQQAGIEVVSNVNS